MPVYKYIHPHLGKELEAISGTYSMQQECQLEYKGRQVYYYTGFSVVDSSCCGPGGCGFAFVVGYVVDLKNEKDGDGTYSSMMEPVTDDRDRQEIRQTLIGLKHVQQVNFWSPQSV